MPLTDFFIVLKWWSTLFLVGAAVFPMTKRLFSSWYDEGYFFAKAVGMAGISYIVYVFGTLHVLPFDWYSIMVSVSGVFVLGMALLLRNKKQGKEGIKRFLPVFFFEEIFFFCCLLFWTWIKAHEPSIQGLEKFMDFGFMQSALNSKYFPSADMWYAGESINYYYFGHLVTAVLTKLSGLSLSVTFNLMLATLFALTCTMSFSIGREIAWIGQSGKVRQILGGFISAFLVTLAGNMQTIYVFTKGYIGDNVVPFWTLFWQPSEFLSRFGEGTARYWYANATRFIPFSIHEFPSYSFVVSDIHGHVLSLPFVFLAIALLIMLWKKRMTPSKDFVAGTVFLFLFYGFLLAVLLMTNAFDGPIYGGLFVVVVTAGLLSVYPKNWELHWKEAVIPISIVVFMAILTALPFLWHFKSFATGIGINCPPAFLVDSAIGPFIFEGVEKCQKSPLWMMALLWGFFWTSGALLFWKTWRGVRGDETMHTFLKVLYLFGFLLIIVPEFLYAKDIYPAHFRSNTMFKLGYQAFILWSIVSSYILLHLFFPEKQEKKKEKKHMFLRIGACLLLFPMVCLVSMYPLFSIRSYFGELREYKGIDGLAWLIKEYPDDWNIMQWLSMRARTGEIPVIVEADGDSYTNYNHVSAFTGIPTVVGWSVHEWLWRGTYDVVSPRKEDVRKIYESHDEEEVRLLLAKYHVQYVLVGKLERAKYPLLDEAKFAKLGTVATSSRTTTLYAIDGGK